MSKAYISISSNYVYEGETVRITLSNTSSSYSYSVYYAPDITNETASYIYGFSSSSTSRSWVAKRFFTYNSSETGYLVVRTLDGSRTVGTDYQRITIREKPKGTANVSAYIETRTSLPSGSPVTGYVAGYVDVRGRSYQDSSSRSATRLLRLSGIADDYSTSIHYPNSAYNYTEWETVYYGGPVKFTARATPKDGGSDVVDSYTINVQSYSRPSIYNLEQRRSGSGIQIRFNYSMSSLGSRNNFYYYYKVFSSSGSLLKTSNTMKLTSSYGTAGYMTVYTSASQTSSYKIELYYGDEVSGKSSNEISITSSTAAVALSLGRDKGIGVGKIWEKGALDVKGDINFDSRRMSFGEVSNTVYENILTLNNKFRIKGGASSTIDMNTGYFSNLNFTSGSISETLQVKKLKYYSQSGFIEVEGGLDVGADIVVGNYSFVDSASAIDSLSDTISNLITSTNNIKKDVNDLTTSVSTLSSDVSSAIEKVDSMDWGGNSNSGYADFGNGMRMCWLRLSGTYFRESLTRYGGVYYSSYKWNYGYNFSYAPYVLVSQVVPYAGTSNGIGWGSVTKSSSTSANLRIFNGTGMSCTTLDLTVIAIGIVL